MVCEYLTANSCFKAQEVEIERLKLDRDAYKKALEETSRLEIIEGEDSPTNYFKPF